VPASQSKRGKGPLAEGSTEGELEAATVLLFDLGGVHRPTSGVGARPTIRPTTNEKMTI
jgi:hypothetical protein